MPSGDGTGPVGRGPMTGRGTGFCAGYSNPGSANPSYGRGLGIGLGRGFGRGYLGRGRGFWWRRNSPESYHAPVLSREDGKTYLENMVKDLEEEIKSIQDRLQKISKDKKETS